MRSTWPTRTSGSGGPLTALLLGGCPDSDGIRRRDGIEWRNDIEELPGNRGPVVARGQRDGGHIVFPPGPPRNGAAIGLLHGCFRTRGPPRPRNRTPDSLNTRCTKPYERPVAAASMRMLSPRTYRDAKAVATVWRSAPTTRRPLSAVAVTASTTEDRLLRLRLFGSGRILLLSSGRGPHRRRHCGRAHRATPARGDPPQPLSTVR